MSMLARDRCFVGFVVFFLKKNSIRQGSAGNLDEPHPEVRREGREPLPDHAGESPLLSRSGGEKGLRGSCAGTSVFPRGYPACRGAFGGRTKGVRYCFALQGGTWDFP